VFEASTCSELKAHQRVQTLSADERHDLLLTYVGDRRNRRHKPGRAFERTTYRFEIVSDYGAFRDLQRHRMLSMVWQPLSPALGASIPETVTEAGFGTTYDEVLQRSRDLYDAISTQAKEQAPYAVCLAFRIRYIMDMNAREAMHVTELRSSPQGHATYRSVAQDMHQKIATVAGHPTIAAAMHYVDYSDSDLERLDLERRVDKKRQTAEFST
jgi:hypothetical protein